MLVKPLVKTVRSIVKEEPIFDWHTARLLQISYCLEESKSQEVSSLSTKLILDSHKHWFLRREAAQLSRYRSGFYNTVIEELENAINKSNLISELPYFLTLLKLSLELNFDSTASRIESSLNDHLLPDDFFMFIGYYSSLTMKSLPSKLENYSWARNNLFLDESDRSIDGISYNLVDFYKLPDEFKFKINFKDYLEEEYHTALELLHKARGFFEKDPDLYFSHTDSFNQILLARIFSKDDINISKYEQGNMIGKIKTQIPYAFPGLDKCHSLREEIPSIHAYSKTKQCLNKSSPSKRFRERDDLKVMLETAYKSILEYIQNNHITSAS